MKPFLMDCFTSAVFFPQLSIQGLCAKRLLLAFRTACLPLSAPGLFKAASSAHKHLSSLPLYVLYDTRHLPKPLEFPSTAHCHPTPRLQPSLTTARHGWTVEKNQLALLEGNRQRNFKNLTRLQLFLTLELLPSLLLPFLPELPVLGF